MEFQSTEKYVLIETQTQYVFEYSWLQMQINGQIWTFVTSIAHFAVTQSSWRIWSTLETHNPMSCLITLMSTLLLYICNNDIECVGIKTFALGEPWSPARSTPAVSHMAVRWFSLSLRACGTSKWHSTWNMKKLQVACSAVCKRCPV